MKPTGPRSRTERPSRRLRARPGQCSGRSRIAGFLVLLCASSAPAHELLSWWNRDLLRPRIEAGDWVRIESLEDAGGEAFADTLRCEVLAAQGSRRWLQWTASRGVEQWLVEIDTARIGDGNSVLDLVTTLYRRGDDGEWHFESLDEWAESAIVRGRLEDPFESPRIQRSALADTLLDGRSVARERILMEERRERKIQLGRQTMVYGWILHSEATLSPDVPIFGVLHSRSTTEESTQRFDADGRAIGAPSQPQRNFSGLRCLEFGSGTPRGLPKGIRLERGRG